MTTPTWWYARPQQNLWILSAVQVHGGIVTVTDADEGMLRSERASEVPSV